MKETIKALLYEWKDKKFPGILDRKVDLERYICKPRKIIVVSGFRRTGKTYLSMGLIKKLLDTRGRESVIHINFEDERIPLRTEFLTQLIPTIRETFSEKIEFLFLDEIQNIDKWGKWLRRVYDTEDFFIFVTGSSSKLSSREIPTELRGRSLDIDIFPLSFKEFLNFRNIKIDMKAARYPSNEKAKVLKALGEYLEFGGLPEIVLTTNEERKIELLQNYFKTVVNRDVIERFDVKNEEGLKAVIRLLLNSTYYSISKLYNTMKSMNYKIGKTTILNYISYIETSYFLHSLCIFSRNVKDQMQYPRKTYFIDNGFITALSLKFSRNLGRLAENLVFIELRRRHSKNINVEPYYWKDTRGREVDFVIKEGSRIKQLIQVCWDIGDPETKEREIKSLLKAMNEFELKEGLVITEDFEGNEKLKRKTIRYIPLWKWLLQD